MKTSFIALIIIVAFIFTFFSLVSWIKDEIIQERVNQCGHTIEEANNPIHWHNGVYSPSGCDINKQ